MFLEGADDEGGGVGVVGADPEAAVEEEPRGPFVTRGVCGCWGVGGDDLGGEIWVAVGGVWW